MAINSDFEYICSTKDAYPQLNNASNIITKYNGALTAKEEYALTLLIPEYARYLKKMLEIFSYDKESIAKRVCYLNRYYNFMHENELDRTFSAQGKFRPTILEEFLFLLFKDYVEQVKKSEDSDGVLRSGAVKAYSNIYFKAKNFKDFIKSPEIGVNEKDQDYAIYRIFDISVNNANTMQIC